MGWAEFNWYWISWHISELFIINLEHTQYVPPTLQTFTRWKLTIQAIEKGVKYL